MSALPAYPHEWHKLVQKRGLEQSTIHTAKLSSGSTIQEEQYLLLRVLWKARPIDNFNWERFELDAWRTTAETRLSTYPSWKIYCDSLSNTASTANNIPESTFALAHQSQLQVSTQPSDDSGSKPSVIFTPVAERTRSKQTGPPTRQLSRMDIGTPTRSSRQQPQTKLLDDLNTDTDTDSDGEEEIDDIFLSSPGYQDISTTNHQTEDEQIVNTALVNFLNALTLHFRLYNLWTLHRKAFRALFTSAAFEARTDGYLKDSESGKPRALVEVKAVRRGKKRAAICMQEAAQMVAWIQSHPDRYGQLNECGRRLHISQDHDQIYVIVAEYNADYLRYLAGEPAPVSFLTMHEFGPWNTRDLKSMKHFAVILVAIVLRAASDREVEERGGKSKAPAGQA